MYYITIYKYSIGFLKITHWEGAPNKPTLEDYHLLAEHLVNFFSKSERFSVHVRTTKSLRSIKVYEK